MSGLTKFNYIYDGSFEGLLTAIYESYYRSEKPDVILRDTRLQEDLFANNIHITTDPEKAEKVYNSIRKKISNEALRNAYNVFLSEIDQAGTWIYQYLKMGWKVGGKLDMYLSDDRVLRVVNMSRKVSFENHRMLGLIRFRKIHENIYYSPIQPDYNILVLAAPHFAERMADQNWIIHDVKRGIGAVYDMEQWYITDIDANPHFNLGKEEIDYQNLWKQFFNSIAIANRTNPKLQKRNMPVRYWKYLVEKQ